MGKQPVCTACPRCGSTGFLPVTSRTLFSFGAERQCASCSTSYTFPTSRWGSFFVVLMGLGLLVEPAYLVCADPRMANEWMVALWGTLAYAFGLCSVIRGMEVLFERRIGTEARRHEGTEGEEEDRKADVPAQQPAGERQTVEAPSGDTLSGIAMVPDEPLSQTATPIPEIGTVATSTPELAGGTQELVEAPQPANVSVTAPAPRVEIAATTEGASPIAPEEPAISEDRETAQKQDAEFEQIEEHRLAADATGDVVADAEADKNVCPTDPSAIPQDSALSTEHSALSTPHSALTAPDSESAGSSAPGPAFSQIGMVGLEFKADQPVRIVTDWARVTPDEQRELTADESSALPTVAAMSVNIGEEPADGPDHSTPVDASAGGVYTPSMTAPATVSHSSPPAEPARNEKALAPVPAVVVSRRVHRPATRPAPKITDNNLLGLDFRQPMPWPKVRGSVIDFHCHLLAARHAKVWFETAWHYGIDVFFTMTPFEEVMGLARDWPGKLHFIAVPQWYYEGSDFVGDWVRRIEMFYNMGARIAKFHMAPQTIVKRGLTLDSPKLEPVFRAIEERGMMIMSHVGDPETWYTGRYADAAKYGTREDHYRMWETMLERCRNTPWIGAHLGGNPENLPRLQSLLDRFPNLMLDCSATRWMAREISNHRDDARDFFIHNADRILYGSDQVSGDDRGFDFLASRWWTHRKLWETAYIGQGPIADPDLPGHAGPQMKGLALPDDVLQKLYHDNAVKLMAKVGVEIEETMRQVNSEEQAQVA